MGTTYTGQKVQDTYQSIIKVSDNTNLTGTAKLLSDGLGNDTVLYLSTSKLGVGVSPTFQFQTSGTAKIGSHLEVGGNLTVNGTTTIVDSTIIAIGDNMIEMAKDNVANTLDIGWYGTINSSGEKYVGMFYDASDGVSTPTFRIGLGTVEPSGTAAWTVKGKLVIGALDATTGVFSGQVTIPVTPLANAHAASKKYVDDSVDGLIDGSGTANDVVMWQDSNTLTDAPIAISGNNSTFAGNVDITGNLKVDDYIEVEASSGFGYLEVGGPAGGYIDLKTPFSDDYDLRFITGTNSISEITASSTLRLNAGNTLTLTLDGSSQDATFAGHVSLLDNKELKLGTDVDVKIYHNNTDAYIQNYTGDLIIENNANDKDIFFRSDNGSGGTALYFQIDGSAELNKFIKNSKHPDNVQAIFGDSNDLKIYHDSNNSYIQDSGTGSLILEGTTSTQIKGSTFVILRSLAGENMLICNANASVDLYYDGVKKLETTSTGVTITGGADTIALVKGTTTSARLDLQTDNHHRFWQTIESDGKFRLFNQTTNTEQFSIASNSDASFAGDITLSNGNALRWTSDDVRIEGTTAGDKIQFYVGGSEILKLEQSGTLSTFAGDILISKSDPKITFLDSSSNTDPSGQIVFSEVSGFQNFDLNYNGTNDRLEFRGRIGSNDNTDLVYINRNTTTPLNVLGGATFAKSIEVQGDTSQSSEGGHIILRANSGGAKEFGIDVDANNNFRIISEDDGTDNNGVAHFIMSNTGAATFASNVNTNGDYLIDSIQILDTSSTYTQIRNPEGDRCIFLGDSADRGNYYDNDIHYFRNAGGGTIKMTLGTQLNPRVDVVPITDSVYDLGKNTIRWANVWADNFNGGTLINGSGTANDVVMWQDSNTLTDAPIAISGNNATFANDLTVSGNTHISGQLGQGVTIANKLAAYGAEFRANGASAQIFFGRNGSSVGTGGIGADSTYVMRVWKSDFSQPFVIRQSGEVGIGTTSPTQSKLVVDGTISIPRSEGIQYLESISGGFRAGIFSTNTNATGVGFNSLRFFVNADSTNAAMVIGGSTNTKNVGIGTTAPGARLQVNGTTSTTGTAFIVRNSSNSSLFSIRDDGRVDVPSGAIVHSGGGYANTTTNNSYFTGALGIGITSPSSQLHLSKAGGTLIKLGTSNNTSEIEAREVGGGQSLVLSSVNSADHLIIDGAGNVGIGTTTPDQKLVVNQTTGGRYVFKGEFNGTNLGGFFVDGSQNMELFLKAAGNVEKVKIDTAGNSHFSGGNVGIGTTSPDNILHIQSASATGAILNLETTHTGGIPIYNMKGAHSAQLRYQDENGNNQSRIDFNDGGDFNFIKATDGTSHLKITSAGNVGIGTTSPSTFANFTNVTIQGGSSGSNLDFKNSSGTRVSAIVTTASNELIIETGTAQPIIYKTNDTERMRITGVGNVGIGTNNPQENLHIKDPSDGIPVFRLEGGSRTFQQFVSGNGFFIRDVTASSNRILLDANGRVGIGTTSPERKLHVFKGESGGATSNSDSSLVLENSSNTYLQFLTPTTVESGILFGDTDNDVGAFTYSHSTNSFNFRTAGVSNRMVINSSGNVGIGTTSPGQKLDVNGNVVIRGGGSHLANSGVGELKLGYAFASGGGTAGSATRLAIQPYAHTGGPFTFVARDTSSSAFLDIGYNAAHLTLKHNGFLGIGTTSPGNKLQVQGGTQSTFFTSDGGRGFKQDGVAFVSTYSNGADANTVNDIGSTSNKWRDAYFSGSVNAAQLKPTNIVTNKVVKFDGTKLDDSTITDTGSLVSFSTDATFAGDVAFQGTTNTYSGTIGQHPNFTQYAGLWNTKGQANNASRYMILNAAEADGYRTYVNGDEVYIRAGQNSTTGQLIIRTTGATFASTVDAAGYRISGSTILSGVSHVNLGSTGSTGNITLRTTSGSILNVVADKVGIGTTSPTADLSVGSTTTSSGDVHLRTTKTAFAITPSNSNAGGILLDLGFVSGGQGPMKFGIGGSERMRITQSGNILINRTSDATNQALQVHGFMDITNVSNSAIRWFDGSNFRGGLGLDSWGTGGNSTDMILYAVNNLFFVTGGGNTKKMSLNTAGTLTVKDDVIAFGSPSDRRLKENIKPIESALDKVSKLEGVTFDWKKSDSILDIKKDIGFIAQDVQKVVPELVRENNNGMLSMRHQGMTPILLEAIKELKAEIEELKKQIK